MSDCLFCKIAAGEVPSTKVYETEDVLAFKDIDPQAPFHVIVIPKKHIASAAEITPENSGVIAKIFEAISVIAAENHLDGGQTVGHIHFHLLARRNLAWPPG